MNASRFSRIGFLKCKNETSFHQALPIKVFRRYSYFWIRTPTLPNDKSYGFAYMHTIKTKRKTAQEEVTIVSFKFLCYLSNLCLF